MKQFACALIAGMMMAAAGPAYSCSGTDLIQKQKAFADAVKAAYARDPGGDAARQPQVQTVIGRHGDLKNSTNGGAITDMLCKENDELLAIYK
jgi:hypothetical protein